MIRSILAASLGIAAGTSLVFAAVPAGAADYRRETSGPGTTIEIAARGAAAARPAGDIEKPSVRFQSSAPVEPGETARITISRATDVIGRPVYFSRSEGGGAAGLVSFSSRRLPETAVFSVALRPVRPLVSPASTLSLSGEVPSLMPVSARALTSGFGMRQHPIFGTLRVHSGVDLAASFGSPIVATSDGVVNTASWAGGYGLLVALDHGKGLQTRYGHMSRLNVVAGQQVRKGDVIGYVGSTGASTGPHLHYEIRIDGQPVNPAGHLYGR